MTAINSSSTPAEVWAAFVDSAGYDEDDDRAKAKTFRTVCRILIGKYRTMSASRDGQSLSLESLHQMLKDVDAWIHANPDPSSPGRARYFAMENFRG
jgi:hypothetical protein